MRQKLVAFGDDYWIENGLGQRMYFVDGKAFRLREHLAFKDMQGNELAAIQGAFMSPAGQAAAADLANFATGGVELYLYDNREI